MIHVCQWRRTLGCMVSMHYETPRVGSEHNRPPDQCKYMQIPAMWRWHLCASHVDKYLHYTRNFKILLLDCFEAPVLLTYSILESLSNLYCISFLPYPAMSKGSEPITGSSHVTTWSGEPDTRRARDTTVTAQRASWEPRQFCMLSQEDFSSFATTYCNQHGSRQPVSFVRVLCVSINQSNQMPVPETASPPKPRRRTMLCSFAARLRHVFPFAHDYCIRFRVWQNLMQRVKLNLHVRGRRWQAKNYLKFVYRPVQSSTQGPPCSFHWIQRNHTDIVSQMSHIATSCANNCQPRWRNRMNGNFVKFWSINCVLETVVCRPAGVHHSNHGTHLIGNAATYTATFQWCPKQRRPKWPQRCTSFSDRTDSTLPFQSRRVSCHGRDQSKFSMGPTTMRRLRQAIYRSRWWMAHF